MKNIVAILVLVFVIALIGFAYFAVKVTKGKNNLQTEISNKGENNKVDLDMQPFKDLTSMSDKFCSIDNEELKGTVKINNGNTTSTLTYKSSSKSYNTIIVNNVMYSWEQGTKNGAKITKDDSKPALEKEFVNALKPFFEDSELECSQQKIAESEFIPPSEINFIDVNALMRN